MKKVTAKQYVVADIRSNNTNLSKELNDLRETVSAIKLSVDGDSSGTERIITNNCIAAAEQIRRAIRLLSLALQEAQKLQTKEDS